MIPIKKKMGVLLMVFPAIAPMSAQTSAEEKPPILMQDYTSKITVRDFNGITLKQQFGSPYGAAYRLSGDAMLYQGLFGLLRSGFTDTSTGMKGVGISNDANVSLSYDALLKKLEISVPAESNGYKLYVVDMNGKNVLSMALTESTTTADLSTFAPGIYMAGVASNNNYSKTLKFIVK